MATNKELEAQVKTLSERVEILEKKTANPKHAKDTSDVIAIICEVLLELIDATRSINNRHSFLKDLAEKLKPYIPKSSA